MKFGIIYSIDLVPHELGNPYQYLVHSLKEFKPQNAPDQKRGCWKLTEKSTADNAIDVDWRHAKYIALLDKKQCRAFLTHFGFGSQPTETMVALGMPDCEPWYGCAPAWSFDSDAADDEGILNVYITPWPDIKRKTGISDREETWERIKGAMKCLFE